jgi:hypothetical protein
MLRTIKVHDTAPVPQIDRLPGIAYFVFDYLATAHQQQVTRW